MKFLMSNGVFVNFCHNDKIDMFFSPVWVFWYWMNITNVALIWFISNVFVNFYFSLNEMSDMFFPRVFFFVLNEYHKCGIDIVYLQFVCKVFVKFL